MMDSTINGRTPEEIKRGLEHCSKTGLATCEGCPYNNAGCYEEQHHIDALAYIQQLEAELAEARKDIDMLGEQAVALDSAYDAMKRERDAAVSDMRDATLCGCHVCKHYYRPDANVRIYACRKLGEFGKFDYIKDDGSMFCGAFEWRGVEVE